jgi:hypothetical protein
MNSGVNSGVEGEKTCLCGRVWLLSKRDVPQRDKDDISCTCGRVLVSWNGGCVWKAILILGEPTFGEIVRYCSPHSDDAQLAKIVEFTGNTTDVRIRLVDGREVVAPWGIVERIKK